MLSNNWQGIDWDNIKKYFVAWWNCEVLDKPLLHVTAPRKGANAGKKYTLPPENWLNKKKVMEKAETKIQNTYFGGAAFPSVVLLTLLYI